MVNAMNEAQFLREQSDQAVKAMGGVIRDSKSDALRVIDPRGWARTHPWKTVAAAAIAGFIAGDTIARPERSVPPASEEPPKNQPRAGRTIVKIIKQARAIVAFVEPFLLELWTAQTASRNGNTGGQQTSQTPAGAPGDSTIWP
jgi:hypothetical protein